MVVDSNFSFLARKWPELSELAQIAENNLYEDSNTTMIKLRMFTEQIADYMFAYDKLEEPEENSLYNKLKLLEREELIKDKIAEIFHTLRIEGNKAVHESYESVEEAKTLLSLSYKLAVWFMQVYGEWDFEADEFKLPEEDTEKDIEQLQEKYDEIIQEMQQEIEKIKSEQKETDSKVDHVEKSKKYGEQVIFNGEENQIMRISQEQEAGVDTIDSSQKFITTDVFDPETEKIYKKVWDAVKRALSGRDCIAYWRYPLFSRRGEARKEPDIVIIDKELGVVVLEVFDYELENIAKVEQETWQLVNGNQITPIYDSEDQLYALRGLYQNERSLRDIYQRYGVVLPEVESEKWQERDYRDDYIIFADQLGSKSFLNRISEIETDNGREEINDKAFEDLLMVLTGQVTFKEESKKTQTDGEEESTSIMDTITGVLRGNKKEEKKKRGEVKSQIKEELYKVDMQQEVIGKTIPPGPQRIRGIAGSGKTVLLAQKAAHMHLKHPDWKIALIFFTRSLYDTVILEVDKWLNRFSNGEVSYDPDDDNLNILHAWGAKDQPGFYREICNFHDIKPLHAMKKVLGDGDPNEKLVKACKLLLDKVDSIKPVYDAILIDEAQDLVVDDEDLKYEGKQPFYWLAYKALKPIEGKDSKRLIWAYDEAQSLNALNIPTAPELFGDEQKFKRMVSGFHEGGINKSEIMNKCYRTPGPVLTAAHAIGMGLLRPEGMLRGFTTQEDWENIGYEVQEGSFNPPGQKVVLHRPKATTPNRMPDLWNDDIIKFNKYETRQKEFEALAENIKYNLEQDELNPSRDILVIALGESKECYNLKTSAAKALKKENIDVFIPSALKNNIIYPKYPNTDPNKFWNKDGVTISTTYRAKGNEAYMVYVIGLDNIAKNESDFALRNQLFVALTRTKGWLKVSGIGEYSLYEEFENVLDSGGTFEFKFQRPLEEKVQRGKKDTGKDKDGKKKIKKYDVVETPTGEEAKVVDKKGETLTVKFLKTAKDNDAANKFKEEECEFIRKGEEVYNEL